jgi:carnitine O-palmitoyltransferase 2
LFTNKFTFNYFIKNNQSGNLLPPDALYGCVKYILDSNCKESEYPLGVLTAENRDTWAEVRSKLELLGNKDQLNAIDSALYCIALDDINTNDIDLLSHNFLYGDPKNRLIF